MKDGNKIIESNSTEEEKDLGVFITRDLKFHEQCVQSVKKAQSVLGMVKRHFKVIHKDDFTAQDLHQTTFGVLHPGTVATLEERH